MICHLENCQIKDVTNVSHVHHLSALQLYLISLFEILKRDKNDVQFVRLKSATVFSYSSVHPKFESLIKGCLCDFSLSPTTSGLMMLLDVGPVPVGRTTYSWDIKTSISTLVHASALILEA